MNYKERIKTFYENYPPFDSNDKRIKSTIETLERRAAKEGLNPDDFLTYRDAKKILRSE